MSRVKRVLNFSIEDTDQVITIINNLTELDVDLDVDTTPSSMEISIYGPENKVRDAVKKVHKLVEETKSS
ncbi:hypothetical protein AKJ50_01470 [candidate division MSBL1 archaeon SCGC-AAA382A13]|uniref:ACT domain-containing protein n=1 Tax=candidate division MSBL1 archaeon SCGC-AAA382A13 TaxID=1698279 RepID=A0A133VFN0_9EURY|nr:hypothetical protein AKJ50_01470 [candidate division MSBL1 archaeon SCGC-AAA382A13]